VSYTWSVKNSSSQEVFSNLTDADFVSFLTAIPGAEFTYWLAMRSDVPQWFPCSELPAFKLRRFGLPPIPTELAMTPEQIAWLERHISPAAASAPATAPPGMQTTVRPEAGFEPTRVIAPAPAPKAPQAGHFTERRRHPRKDIKLQVVLISDNNAFRTFTKNISMGGMALEKAVPEKLLGTECTIFLSEPGNHHKFHFTGSVLAEQAGAHAPRNRLVFGQLDDVSREALGRWIDATGGEEKKSA
jgi:hypothetical protein